MERKGAVPIPYIIALLLGIAVVAILGYWFFVLGGQWAGEASLQSCRNKAITYCLAWQANGYADAEEEEPEPHGWFGTEEYAPDCSRFLGELGFSSGTNFGEDKEACQDILFATGYGTTTITPTTEE